MKKVLMELLKDRKGYGSVELMVIIAILGSVAVAVGNIFKTEFPSTATAVGDKIEDFVSTW